MKQTLLVASLLSAFFIAACGAGGNSAPSASGTPAEIWKTLRRPLEIGTVASGKACPITPGQEVSPDFGVALGSGPVYPVGLGSDAVLRYGFGDEVSGFQGPWGGQKVLWIARPDFAGPVLIRGRQMDGPNELRFGEGSEPVPELRLPEKGGSSPSGWRNWPTYTRVREPGCYAYQIDTLESSYTVIFRAEPAS